MPDNIPDGIYDVAVIGCGPAGSISAYNLAKKGLRVAAFDKEEFPRYKSCGGCLSTKAQKVLDFDVSEVSDLAVYGATFSFKSARFLDIISERPIGYNVRRDAFDNFLKDRAKAAGAKIFENCRVREVTEEGSFFTIACEGNRNSRARFVVFADGAGGIGRRYFRLEKKECAVSITAEVPCDPSRMEGFRGRLFIDFGSVPSGYCWIFPKKDVLSIGIAADSLRVGGRIRQYFDGFISSHRVLKNLRVENKAGWTIPLYYGKGAELTRGRAVAVGDAGHVVDPFLGEGIYYAIASANAASSAIADSIGKGTVDLTSYQDWLRKEVYPGFSYLLRLSELVYNHPRLWYRLVEKEPQIMLRYYNVIRGEESPGDFYRWVAAKVKQKPWKVLRGWLESRFIGFGEPGKDSP